MNNEKKLYDLIVNSGGMLAMRDVEVAKLLGVSRYSIPNYKKRLLNSGYIETKVKVIDDKPITLYRVVKEYSGEVVW